VFWLGPVGAGGESVCEPVLRLVFGLFVLYNLVLRHPRIVPPRNSISASSWFGAPVFVHVVTSASSVCRCLAMARRSRVFGNSPSWMFESVGRVRWCGHSRSNLCQFGSASQRFSSCYPGVEECRSLIECPCPVHVEAPTTNRGETHDR